MHPEAEAFAERNGIATEQVQMVAGDKVLQEFIDLGADNAKERERIDNAIMRVEPDKPITLKELRTQAQERGIRVDGKRPSLCTKAELIQALQEANK